MPDRPVLMILPALSQRLSALCVPGGLVILLVLGTILLSAPVSGQNAEPDLDAINDEIRDRQSRRIGLEEEAETLQNQSKRLRRRVIELARDIRNIDVERERIEERLSELAVTESQLDAQLQRDRAALSRTLAGLQALETQPPPAFAVHPDDALAAVQGQLRWQALFRPCRTGPKPYAANLLNWLPFARIWTGNRANCCAPSRMQPTPNAVLRSPGRESRGRGRHSRAAAREAEASPSWCGRPKTSKTLRHAAKAQPPQPATPPAEGGISPGPRSRALPVIGQVEQRFGQADTNGQTVQGLAIAARPGAQITAPYDGRVYIAVHSGNMAALLFSVLTAITR